MKAIEELYTKFVLYKRLKTPKGSFELGRVMDFINGSIVINNYNLWDEGCADKKCFG